MRVPAAVLCAVLVTGAAQSGELGSAAPNTWVKLDECPTGGRNSPMFFYAPAEARFYLVGGTPGGGYANAKRHFEIETFDLAAAKWANAYPPGAPWKTESGVTDAPAVGKGLIVNSDGATRLAMFGSAYGTDSRAHFQWAFDPDSGRLFAYLFNKTVSYDLKTRAWEDTGAEPFSKGGFAMVWGNMCYDPVNKEVLSIGGSSAERGGTPGTYVFKIAEKAWKKVDPGSEELKGLHEKAWGLRRQGWALLSACRSRFFVTESESEAKAKLSESAAALEAAAKNLADELGAAKLAGTETAAGKRAAGKLADALAKIKAVAGKLDGAMSPELIAEVKLAYDELEAAELALAPEPPGRAHSQPAFDAKSGKIVLFGGSGLDRCYADTWLYDPKTRGWEQRWPKLSPSPRAGHALVALPKSGRLALAGGYTINGWFREVPHQLWTYDVAADAWSLHLSLPIGPKNGASQGAPRGGTGGNYAGGGSPCAGAATPEDVLVMVDTFSTGRNTWACKVDVAKKLDAEAEKLGVPPGTMSFAKEPAIWEKAAAPEPAGAGEVLKGLAPNTWTALKPPKTVDHRAWNTTAYDPDRQQLLWWGGGHVTYMGTDVAHYSVRANRWTLGYPPDLPTEPTGGFYVKAALSFQDRPQVPVHAYQAYAYDPPSGKMFYLNRAYDVAGRQWEPEPYPGLASKGCMHTMLETTPQGAVALSEHGLFRFEWKEKSWKKLPWNGPAFGAAWCDGHALCYDSKRDCLWAAHGDIFRYDLKTGTVEKLGVKPPKALGKFALWREQIHVPDADLILLMRQFKGLPGGATNVAFDPESKKYYAVELGYAGGKPRELSWSAALHFDRRLGLALLHDGFSGVWALKFDRKTAKLTEIAE